MKKFIIAAALVLVSGVTAFSLTNSNTNNDINEKVKSEKASMAIKESSRPKSDIATAD
ncbi:hypothetical protein [Mucilaginibacter glaciei]|uniref:Uncharacterized protein n=1 Tax=Mucilaginibacter glaciei TaxID=2772109 RepID=A0A926S2D9_9SPHI|nr:hypothetical protein [Mucilaginibacter glaciei]MBD1395020.1 hypothetical protein [Mucilaginibacter glaciei]